MEFTKEQETAIELRNKNILVSAAAGSGKTMLLIERLKRLVLRDKVSCDQLLILTFTKAAAAEMKERFKQALLNSLKVNEFNVDPKYVLEQIGLLNDANISTIDKFAHDMVRRYFEIAQVDPSFRIGDENELELLKKETINEVLEDLFSENDNEWFLEFADLYSNQKDLNNLKEVVFDFARFLEQIPYPEKWYYNCLNFLDKKNFTNHPLLKFSLKEIQNEVNLIKQQYKKFENELVDLNLAGKSAEEIPKEINTILNLKIDNLEDLKKLNEITFPTLRFKKGEDSSLAKEIRNKAKKSINELKENYAQLVLEEEFKVEQDILKQFKSLYRLTNIYNENFNNKKKNSNILSFSDIEKKLLEILKDSRVQEEFKNQFSYILIDEFQDTNDLQEEIINYIENGHNRFMVGDLKQSIYRFRNSDPEIFLQKYNNFQEGSENNELVLLNRNFRSSKSIINSINFIFEKIMTKDFGEIDYDEKAKLIPFRKDETEKVQVNLIIPESDVDKKELEARFIAQKIKALVKSGEYAYSDFAILYRSINNKANVILDVFSQENIPIIFDGSSLNISSKEIDLFIQLLSLIDNHKQDLPLLSIFNLPIFNFSIDDEVKIKKAYPEEIHFYQATENYKNEKDDLLAQKLKDFYSKLDKWRTDSKYLEIDEYLWQLILESKFNDYINSLNNTEDRNQNLRVLLDQAKDFKKTSLNGITSFLEYIRRLEKNEQILPTNTITSKSENAVRLMSIHKSKGLEFPVVFLAELNYKGKNVKRRPFLFDKKLGFSGESYSLYENSLIRKNNFLNKAMIRKKMIDQLAEELRLLYVAMTRAQDRLFLSAVVSEKDSDSWNEVLNPLILTKRHRYIDWIMLALNDNLTHNFEINYLKESDLEETFSIEKEKNENFNSLKKLVLTQLNKEDDYIPKEIINKVSVSQIKHSGIQKEKEIELNSLYPQKSNKFEASEIGTAIHRILQHLDYSLINPVTDNVSELNNQIEKNKRFLDNPEIIKEIDVNLLNEYFNSDLGQRFLKAYHNNPDNIQTELSFNCDMKIEELSEQKEVEITGIIDCCFLEDDQWVIIDYKTDHFINKSAWDKRLEEYTKQVNYYEKALEKLTDYPIKEKHLYFLNEKKDVLI